MRLCHLSYRLKNSSDIHTLSFPSFEEAYEHLIEQGLQVVVGNPKVENPHVFFEKAAERSKADWFEFFHTEEK